MLHKGRTSGDGFEGTWTLELGNQPNLPGWEYTRSGELRSTYVAPSGELIMPTAATATGTTLSTGMTLPFARTHALYRIHLVTDEDEVVNEGLFSDFRIVATDATNAKEQAIHTMGRIGYDLDKFQIVVELIGYIE